MDIKYGSKQSTIRGMLIQCNHKRHSHAEQSAVHRSLLISSNLSLHSLQAPYQCLLTQVFRFAVGKFVGLGLDKEAADSASSHIKPNQRFDVHVTLAEGAYDCEAEVVGAGVVEGMVVESLQENQPGVLQVSLD